MTKTIDVSELTSFSVAPNGDDVTLSLVETDGTATALKIGFSCVTQLVMTLPRIQAQALRAKHDDPTLRVVYPVGPWTLEASNDPSKVILTLITTDGFHASFALPARDIVEMGETASRALAGVDLAVCRH